MGSTTSRHFRRETGPGLCQTLTSGPWGHQAPGEGLTQSTDRTLGGPTPPGGLLSDNEAAGAAPLPPGPPGTLTAETSGPRAQSMAGEEAKVLCERGCAPKGPRVSGPGHRAEGMLRDVGDKFRMNRGSQPGSSPSQDGPRPTSGSDLGAVGKVCAETQREAVKTRGLPKAPAQARVGLGLGARPGCEATACSRQCCSGGGRGRPSDK